MDTFSLALLIKQLNVYNAQTMKGLNSNFFVVNAYRMLLSGQILEAAAMGIIMKIKN